MKRFRPLLLATLVASVLLTTPAFATHDSGQGKSRDHPGSDPPPIATAPEPSTAVLFGSGLGLLYLRMRRRRQSP